MMDKHGGRYGRLMSVRSSTCSNDRRFELKRTITQRQAHPAHHARIRQRSLTRQLCTARAVGKESRQGGAVERTRLERHQARG
jgi:hypothetical protein